MKRAVVGMTTAFLLMGGTALAQEKVCLYDVLKQSEPLALGVELSKGEYHIYYDCNEDKKWDIKYVNGIPHDYLIIRNSSSCTKEFIDRNKPNIAYFRTKNLDGS